MRAALALGGLAVVAGLTVAVPASADAETCQGKPATIVQSTGTVQGTDGNDVIVGGDHTSVLAGAGDDTVCVTGGKVDGGGGVDSIELVGEWGDEPGATVVDFERLDVRTFYNLGYVNLEWTEVPSELSGAVDASYDGTTAKVLDNPTVYLVAPEDSDDRLRVDLRSERVSLGEGLGFTLSGVNDIGMTADKIRAFGNRYRNYFFLSGCDVVARGGNGNDRLWASDRRGDKTCPGVRLLGQKGPDKLEGTKRNDTLIGGQGRDLAYGDKGKDRCVAEKKTKCER